MSDSLAKCKLCDDLPWVEPADRATFQDGWIGCPRCGIRVLGIPGDSVTVRWNDLMNSEAEEKLAEAVAEAEDNDERIVSIRDLVNDEITIAEEHIDAIRDTLQDHAKGIPEAIDIDEKLAELKRQLGDLETAVSRK